MQTRQKHQKPIQLALSFLVLALVSTPVTAQYAAAGPQSSALFASGAAGNQIDVIISKGLKARGLSLAELCSDEVFLRRAYLDVIGTLPELSEVDGFLTDTRKDKRSRLIESLLAKPEFASYQALKWGDVLRIKAEYPINLWPNAAQAYHRWVLEALGRNMPYDQFARELLTASGSNFRVPQVNFYRAIQGTEPSAIAKAAALTFMGTRLETWPASKRTGMEAFFSRVAYKPTAEWKEEIVHLDPTPAGPITAVFPDGKTVTIPPHLDPRAVFARWLTRRDNPWFAKNIVNRIWFWHFGRGIIHEPDDIRPGSKAVYPELLKWLESELIRSNYNLRRIYRLILNSRTYQQSPLSDASDSRRAELFAAYPIRRLEAEVLMDALHTVFGTPVEYSSSIPEPFTFTPPHLRTIDLPDGSITSPFLEMFGRPARDTGLSSERNNEISDAQRLYLINSSEIQKMVQQGWKLGLKLKGARKRGQKPVHIIYRAILSRNPTAGELRTLHAHYREKKMKRRDFAMDLMWTLINSKEFLYRH